jgi:hypothetical protein
MVPTCTGTSTHPSTLTPTIDPTVTGTPTIKIPAAMRAMLLFTFAAPPLPIVVMTAHISGM